ncbi:MAG: hypothetical protein BRD55_04090 [Bacteroidetes bacterium SW_9_63_38]|nr:MAG: hypothetical protein BRD55_04090 [Bacteroidetes bacterium SW_9_63_38]
MADDNGMFFSSVFDEPEDDPLLEDEEPSSDASSEPTQQHEMPSWLDEEERTASSETEEDPDPAQKTIIVDQRSGKRKGLDELNRCIEEGWELVGLALHQPDNQSGSAAAPVNRQFVAELSQEGPSSLFDFGTEA